MYSLLTIIFINQRHDLKFVTKFRNISKKCREISEYWLTEILESKFVDYVDISSFKYLRSLNLCQCIINKDLMINFPQLTYLDFGYNQLITDENIKTLTNLTTLKFKYSDVTDDAINKLTNLTNLHFYGNKLISDNSIKELTSLRKLYIVNTNIGDEGIKSLTNLRCLNASWTKVTDSGIGYLTSLKHLSISSNIKISDKTLESLTSLVKLDICIVNIMHEPIKYLSKLRSLNTNWKDKFIDDWKHECIWIGYTQFMRLRLT